MLSLVSQSPLTDYYSRNAAGRLQRLQSYFGRDAAGRLWATCRVQTRQTDGRWVDDGELDVSVLVGAAGAADAMLRASRLFTENCRSVTRALEAQRLALEAK